MPQGDVPVIHRSAPSIGALRPSRCTLLPVNWGQVIRECVRAHDGLATRRQLLERVPAAVLDGYIGRQKLVRVFPHVYRLREAPDDDLTLLRAALLHAGPAAALSHTTALSVWGLWQPTGPLHLTVDHSIRRAGAQGLVVHRRLRFDPESAQCVQRRGLRVTVLPRSIIDAWPLLPVSARRPLALDVTRRGLTTTALLRDALDERPNVGGRRLLQQTLDLIDDGCQSELEAHGVLNVFRHRSLPPSVGQYRLKLPAGTVSLDRAWPEAKLAVELDGARYHTSPEDRRRDLARDRELAAAGWVVLRFTYAEVLRDPEGVRARVLAVYRARQAQLRVG
jgi:very-short-patch-repair endonuclease